jgi:hypothetical protein
MTLRVKWVGAVAARGDPIKHGANRPREKRLTRYITTAAGSANVPDRLSSCPPAKRRQIVVTGVAVDSAGAVYVVDGGKDRVLKLPG